MTLVRTFDAPRDLVFRLWTDPDYVSLWWGVEGATNPTCRLDVRPGGRWHIDMRTQSGVVFPNGGEYLVVVRNERLVYTDVQDACSPAWNGSPPGVMVHTVTFEDAGEGTRVTLNLRFASAADRDRLLATGFGHGVGQSLDRFERLLLRINTGMGDASPRAAIR
jgi:uncharacterized protein YndB with AHSA1/START domain